MIFELALQTGRININLDGPIFKANLFCEGLLECKIYFAV